MRFPPWLKVFGDQSYRGPCDKEETEQLKSFDWLEYNWPAYYRLAVHPKNGAKRSWGQVAADRRMGALNKGASDIIIPGAPAFVCELKKANHTKSYWEAGQKEYLEAAHNEGAFACVALGFEGFKLAFLEWRKVCEGR